MAADKKQNRKSPSEETIKALGNSIDECWNELNNLPKKEFPPVQTGEIISSTWNNASGKESRADALYFLLYSPLLFLFYTIDY